MAKTRVTRPTVDQLLDAAHFGADAQSKPCEICGEITFLNARVKGRFVFLCRRNGHWSKDGLRKVLERSDAI